MGMNHRWSGQSEQATISDQESGVAQATFSRHRTFVTIQNKTGADLHVRLNGTSMTDAGQGDFVMADGDYIPISGLEIKSLLMYTTGTITPTGASKNVFVSGW